MNRDALEFLKRNRSRLAGRVLDVGSYNVNGQARDVIGVSVGVDARPGPGVDRVCRAEALVDVFGSQTFDSVVCIDTLEHIERWKDAALAIWGVLKDGGNLALIVPDERKGYHGYPMDYWRWSKEQLLAMFRVEPESLYKGYALIAQKNGHIPDVGGIEPMRVYRA